jgi:predicted RNase H-like HicB family nuclease
MNLKTNQYRGRNTPMSKLFTVFIQKDEAWYVAKCLENSVASQGATMDSAIDNLREALLLYYEDERPPVFNQAFFTTLEVVL